MRKKILVLLAGIVLTLTLFMAFYTPPLPEKFGHFESELYLGKGDKTPLIVGFGGGEGGNGWTKAYWQEIREKFAENGYSFLAIGYFGSEETPTYLDRISLDAIHTLILKEAQHPKINENKIAVIGGSKGGELVLNLASRFHDIKATVAIVPSHVSFPALTLMANTSSWSYQNEEVAYLPAPFRTIFPALKGDLYEAHSIILEDAEEMEKAIIQVENINGPILLMSAKNDEQWPSTYMSNQIMQRLASKKFEFYYEHKAYEGGHAEPLQHFDEVIVFLNEQFK